MLVNKSKKQQGRWGKRRFLSLQDHGLELNSENTLVLDQTENG